MKWKFAAHKWRANKFAPGRFRGLGVDPVIRYASHYHVLEGPSQKTYPLEGPSKKLNILVGP